MHQTSASLLVALLTSAGCVTYKPVIVDQKTTLERDLLGQFELLGEPVPLAGATASTPARLPEGERALLQAALDLQLVEHDIRPLLDQQVIGEARDGRLALLVETDDEQIKTAVERANRLRERLFERLIAQRSNLSQADLPQVQQAYQRIRVADASPGHRVQRLDGAWFTVKAADR
jgi:uncharacterized protein YdbL (DUF1318 family)